MCTQLKLAAIFIAAVAMVWAPAAFAQQSQPIGTANAIGTVSNSNGATTTSSGVTSTLSSSSSRPVLLLPNGTRTTTSNFTITVCDDFSHSFPEEVDVCSLR
jgi:hypothetical protein